MTTSISSSHLVAPPSPEGGMGVPITAPLEHTENIADTTERSADALRPPSLGGALRSWVVRRLLPKTMVGLVATSKGLAMAPLVAMLVVMGVALDRMLLRGEQLVGEGQKIEVYGATLRTELEDLERVALQHYALEDPALLEIIRQRLATTRAAAARFSDDRLPTEVRLHARELTDGLDQISRNMTLANDAQRVGSIRTLAEKAENVVTEGRVAIYGQVQELNARSVLVRNVLVLSVMIVVLLTIALTLGLSRVIARPLHSLRAAIAALGTANYESPIEIEYPRELARLGEKLEWLRRRLRDLEADKDRFLRHVSHELKTPLASLREGTDLLLERSFGTLNARQAEVAQILAESALDLDAQIRNLLAYAEWRRGQRDVEMSWIDGSILVDEVVSSQRLTLSKRKLDIHLDLRAPLIYGHRWSLRVSLGNLLSNAVKHAPRGSTIDVSIDRRHGRCRLSVRDRGRGVPVSERERILEPFVRGSDPEESGMRGTGIGLSIVNETVKAHGGTLEVQEADPGARFVLDWPSPETDAH
nr:HAMP domain-containing sensor histidine kinase [Panacagrimonas sp.]